MASIGNQVYVQDAYLDFINEFFLVIVLFSIISRFELLHTECFFQHTDESFTEQCPYGKVLPNFRRIRQKPTFKLLIL